MATSQRWLGKQAGVHGFGLLFGFGKSRLRVRVISAWMKQQWGVENKHLRIFEDS